MFLPAENVGKFAEKQLVCLALAPLNFKAFAVVGTLPHAFRSERYSMRRARLSAQLPPQLVCTAQHPVIANLRVACVGNPIAMAAKK